KVETPKFKRESETNMVAGGVSGVDSRGCDAGARTVAKRFVARRVPGHGGQLRFTLRAAPLRGAAPAPPLVSPRLPGWKADDVRRVRGVERLGARSRKTRHQDGQG